MFKVYKTELNPTVEQANKIRRTIGVCRYVYNWYIATNIERHNSGLKFMYGMDFAKWMNNEYLPQNPDKAWIKEVSSKSVKKSIMDAEYAYKRFFNGLSKFPRYKKKGKQDPRMYFVKTDSNAVIHCERHRLKIPTIGWVRLKEFGYIPTNKNIKSGSVFIHAGRFFVSVLVEDEDIPLSRHQSNGIGVDLGIIKFATVSNGMVFNNINYTDEIMRLTKKLKREQRCLARKYESLKRGNKKKGEATQNNLQKQKLKVQRIHYRLNCIRTDYVNKTIAELVKTKPEYVAIEDLNVVGMLKNRHLSKSIMNQKFGIFRSKLTSKCHENNIELRIVDRWFPSSKTCHSCGCINKKLTLKDRIFRCECGYSEDRDFNAALNLRDANCYTIA